MLTTAQTLVANFEEGFIEDYNELSEAIEDIRDTETVKRQPDGTRLTYTFADGSVLQLQSEYACMNSPWRSVRVITTAQLANFN